MVHKAHCEFFLFWLDVGLLHILPIIQVLTELMQSPGNMYLFDVINKTDVFNGLFYFAKTLLVIRLLWLFNEMLLSPIEEWFTPSFLEVMKKISDVSKWLLAFSIYYPIT